MKSPSLNIKKAVPLLFSMFQYFFLYFFQIVSAQEQSDTPNVASYEIREHSLVKPYPAVFSTGSSYWHLTGNTIVTDRWIRLTADTQSKQGGLWNLLPVTYPDWEMHVHFKVHGTGKELFGDGLVIWYVRDPKHLGPVFGYQDYFHGLGIVLDTYSNHNGPHNHAHPYISAMVNNGTLHYDHDRDGTHTQIAGCESAFRGRDTDTLIAIRYKDDKLTVSTDVDGRNVWRECFSAEGVRLPTHYYFGFSAATGELTDSHDIISVHTYQLDSSNERKLEDRQAIVPFGLTSEAERLHVDDPKSVSWTALKIFFYVLLFLIISVGLAIGGYFYMNSRRYHKSRFY